MEILSDATFKGNLKVEGPLVVSSDVYVHSKSDENRVIHYNNGTIVNATEIIFHNLKSTNGIDSIYSDDLFCRLNEVRCNVCAVENIKNNFKNYTVVFPQVSEDCTTFRLVSSIDYSQSYVQSVQFFKLISGIPGCSNSNSMRKKVDFDYSLEGCEYDGISTSNIIITKANGVVIGPNEYEMRALLIHNPLC